MEYVSKPTCISSKIRADMIGGKGGWGCGVAAWHNVGLKVLRGTLNSCLELLSSQNEYVL